MNGLLLLLVQAFEVIGSIIVIVWAVHEIKMAHKELREIERDVKEVRNDLNTECTTRETADKQLKKLIDMVVKDLNKLYDRVKKIEKRKK